ncbi:MAG: DUF1592 domain-containing protein [Lentisphaeraceae bacterium]|nr:DUF1592 domain-containing protein [Lentisphaeraceae bacterium]
MRTLFIYVLLLSLSTLAQERHIQINEDFRSFFTSYCTDCHNSKKQKGKVQLDDGFSFKINSVQDADRWQKILTSINSNEMPPEDETQPKAKDKAEFLEMLSRKLVDARKLLSDSGNETVMRRLNRAEYANTMKNLLGVKVDVDNLPADHASGSFNTNGGSLFMSANQIEQYLIIAKKALKESFVTYSDHKLMKARTEPEQTTTKRIKNIVLAREEKMARAFSYTNSKDPKKTPQQFGFDSERGVKSIYIGQDRFYLPQLDYVMHPLSKKGALLSLNHPNPIQSVYLENKKLPSGFYKVRAAVGRTQTATEERSFLDLGYKSKEQDDLERLETFHITSNYKKPQIIEATVYINDKQNRVFLSEKQTKINAKAQQAKSRRINGRSTLGFSLWVDWVEWEGPLKVQGPELVENLLVDFKENPSDEKVIETLENFAKKTFRQDAPSKEYIAKLLKLYKSKLKLHENALEAIVDPLAIILSSPGFLYLSEQVQEDKSTKLSQRELAVRLAYFLWSEQPDQELLTLAKEGKLSSKQTLTQQIDRMIADKKFEKFIRSFTYQWLDMERLSFFQYDTGKFPTFDETMRWNIAEEVYQTIKYITLNNLKANNLVKSDFIVINSLLAQHYDIPAIKGTHFRKVKLAEGSVRGGLTGMAAIHAMGSDGVYSSPVERGSWVLRKILNNPPPPAPANVPQLAEVGEGLTVRQMLIAHQEQPQCAHCHKKIDPIGFGLENFGPTGKWRKKVNRNKTSSLVDPSGKIFNGPKFNTYLELRDILHSQSENFYKGLIQNMLEYSLGRKVSFSDQDNISRIYDHMNKNGETVRSIIHAIVNSKSFKFKN